MNEDMKICKRLLLCYIDYNGAVLLLFFVDSLSFASPLDDEVRVFLGDVV